MFVHLKNLTAKDWIVALTRDGFSPRKSKGSHRIYQHPDGRHVLLVYHKQGDTFGPKTTKKILQSINWNEVDLRRLGML